MFKKKITVFAAIISYSLSALAGAFGQPVVMDSRTQTGDTAELRFDPAPSNTGVLLVLGDHTGTARLTYHFLYDVPEQQPDPTAKRINVAFADNSKLHISCDPLSENCRSLEYFTEGTNTFWLMWKLQHNEERSDAKRKIADSKNRIRNGPT